jgi:hypothetical protein
LSYRHKRLHAGKLTRERLLNILNAAGQDSVRLTQPPEPLFGGD